MERSRRKRAAFVMTIGQYEPYQIVAVDESSWDRRAAYKGRVWALKGRRAYRSCFFVRGRRYALRVCVSSIADAIQILCTPSYVP
jgi:hypothetical protein